MDFKRKISADKLGKVLVLGAGVTGSAVADYLQGQKHRLDSFEIVDEASLDATKHYDICIASPGISEFSDFYKKAKECSDEVISEVEFAFRESEAGSVWVAITGTNGKTTTTALTDFIFKAAGKTSVAVGNIGQTCISQVDGNEKIYVVECSSYQLASISKFEPKACAILNITPDHIKWHQGLENYAKAKFKIFQNTKNNADALVFLEDSLVSQIDGIKDFSCEVVTDKNSDKLPLVLSIKDQMKIKGEHNIQNAVCAATLAGKLGVDDETIAKALVEFNPLEHRIEPCGDVNGVHFFNDSKATNVDSTIKALSAFSTGNVILLLGGTDKGSDLTPLVDECKKTAGAIKLVKTVVCFGASKERFLPEFKKLENDGVQVLEAEHLSDALGMAVEVAAENDSVLLSPACASFDEFSGFEERGRFFKELVRKLDA